MRKTVADRFLEKVDRSNPEGCWPWTAAVDTGGYGQISLSGTMVLSHRLMYQWVRGDIPDNYVVRHTCDVRNCVNPDHLEVGTQGENIRDRERRGRGAKGEVHGKAKLTRAQVKAIRADLRPHPEIAKDFGVSSSTICNIKRRHTWKHV